MGNRRKPIEASYPTAIVFEACRVVTFPLPGISAACVTTGLPKTCSAAGVEQDRKSKCMQALIRDTVFEFQALSKTAHVCGGYFFYN